MSGGDDALMWLKLMQNPDFVYWLMDGQVQPCPNIHTWAKWLQASVEQRRIAITTVECMDIATTFFGIDLHCGAYPDPLLWETVVFHSSGGVEKCSGYASRAEATIGHLAMVGLIAGITASEPVV